MSPRNKVSTCRVSSQRVAPFKSDASPISLLLFRIQTDSHRVNVSSLHHSVAFESCPCLESPKGLDSIRCQPPPLPPIDRSLINRNSHGRRQDAKYVQQEVLQLYIRRFFLLSPGRLLLPFFDDCSHVRYCSTAGQKMVDHAGETARGSQGVIVVTHVSFENPGQGSLVRGLQSFFQVISCFFLLRTLLEGERAVIL